MIEALHDRFGAENVKSWKQLSSEVEILLISLKQPSPVQVLMTKGLSNYKMPVHPMYEGREYNELFFCLPRYWDISESDNPNRQWPVEWLEKLVNHVLDKNLWYGPGHTIQCYPDYAPLSFTMKQNHLMLIDPLFLQEEMKPLEVDGKRIYFLAGLPIFGDEMDYKQGKGTQKLLDKFRNKNINEKLDDFRETVLKSRWKFW